LGAARSPVPVWRWIALMAMLAGMLWPALAAQGQTAATRAPAAQPGPVIVLDVDGAIGPATTEYIRDGLSTAKERNARLLVIRMDTPGGLDSATRDIIAEILASPVPVATFVAPAGARAASAGTYILYASHLAAMAPGTHLGAATPVSMGGGSTPLPGGGQPDTSEEKAKETAEKAPTDAMTAKVVNDAAAYLASLAALHGRNPEFAEAAVRQAATLTSAQALDQNVIEVLAADMDGLIAAADGRTVQLAGDPHVLALSGAEVVEVGASWRNKALAAITDPNIAYLLLLVGIYGLIFEFLSPGSFGPGVIGAVSLVVALFSLNLLPVNYAGLILIALGIGLMTAEAMTPSIGVLGIGGAAALALGSLILFKGPIPEMQISPWLVVVVVASSLAFFVLALGAAWRSRKRAVAIGNLVGAAGPVLSWAGDEGFVQLEGERWQARSARPLAPGQTARVTARDGLTVLVEGEGRSDAPP
jgi:membrane-bound serine protease (ClpP class)